MESLIAWSGFLGAGLLVAGPIYQAVIELEAEAFERFKEQFRNSPIVSNNLKVGDIPASYRVQLKDPKKFPVVTSQFDGAPGVALALVAAGTGRPTPWDRLFVLS